MLVRVITRDDKLQAAAADEFVRSGAWISHLVLAETTWVLLSVYELSHRRIANVIDVLLQHESLSVQDAETVAAALTTYRRTPAIGFSDCLILEIARKTGNLPLATFDKSLAKVDGAERI